jgi:DDE domain
VFHTASVASARRKCITRSKLKHHQIKKQWYYLYRAVDSAGQSIDFLLSKTRDATAAEHFFRKALRATHTATPRVITVDKNAAYPPAFATLQQEGQLPARCTLRQCKLTGCAFSGAQTRPALFACTPSATDERDAVRKRRGTRGQRVGRHVHDHRLCDACASRRPPARGMGFLLILQEVRPVGKTRNQLYDKLSEARLLRALWKPCLPSRTRAGPSPACLIAIPRVY